MAKDRINEPVPSQTALSMSSISCHPPAAPSPMHASVPQSSPCAHERRNGRMYLASKSPFSTCLIKGAFKVYVSCVPSDCADRKRSIELIASYISISNSPETAARVLEGDLARVLRFYAGLVHRSVDSLHHLHPAQKVHPFLPLFQSKIHTIKWAATAPSSLGLRASLMSITPQARLSKQTTGRYGER